MPYELDFLQVGDGNGDAIGLRYGNYTNGFTIHVVDGGFTTTGERLVNHINFHYGRPRRIEHVVLTHADNDHAPGLINVIENFEVGSLWMNRPWLYSKYIINNFDPRFTVDGLTRDIRSGHEYLVDLENAAIRKGVPIREAFQGTVIGAFTVLAPTIQRYVSLIDLFDKTPTSHAEKPASGILASMFNAENTVQSLSEGLQRYSETWQIEKLSENAETKASNESSIVQLGQLDGELILLTGDVGPVGLSEARDYVDSRGLTRPLNVFQVPHHGSRRDVTPSVLNRWLGLPNLSVGITRGYGLCSLGKNKDDFPRRRVNNACLRRGYPIFTTKTGDLLHHRGLPARKGYSTLTAVPFASNFEE